MKNFIILGVLALFVFIASPAVACNYNGPGNDGSYRNNDYSGDNRGNDYSGNRNNDNSGDYRNNTITGNKTGVFDNKVTIKDNLNDNQVGLVNQKGKGTKQVGLVNQAGHHNTQIVGGAGQYEGGDAQGQKQGQIQGQAQKQQQGQLQGQGQSQDNVSNNEGVSLEVNQNFEDKRDHITGPNVLQSDAKLSSGRAFSTKVQGAKAFFSNVKEMTKKQAKKLASKASDITCEEALLMENDFATDKIKCAYFGEQLPGQFMGYLYMGSDGDDVNTLAMIGEAGNEAMKAGATHMRLVLMESGEMAQGKSWNIGFGGGASVITGGNGRLAVAPNGGFGIGSANAFNELRPEMVFELTFDKALTSNYKLSKADYGWSASLIEGNQVR